MTRVERLKTVKPEPKSHLYHPVFQYVSLCGLGLGMPAGARMVYLGGPEVTCITCRRLLIELVEASLGIPEISKSLDSRKTSVVQGPNRE